MYVCVCFAVTEDEIQETIDGGATTRDEVTRECRAGGDCGSCHEMIDGMLRTSAADDASSPHATIPCERLVRRRNNDGQAA